MSREVRILLGSSNHITHNISMSKKTKIRITGTTKSGVKAVATHTLDTADPRLSAVLTSILASKDIEDDRWTFGTTNSICIEVIR